MRWRVGIAALGIAAMAYGGWGVLTGGVATDRVVTAIRKYAGAMLESLALFDVYEGPQVAAGKRSLAYRLTFRAPDRTLSDADVSKLRAKIVRGLEHDIGATLRS